MENKLVSQNNRKNTETKQISGGKAPNRSSFKLPQLQKHQKIIFGIL
jgi:hypothetical protein